MGKRWLELMRRFAGRPPSAFIRFVRRHLRGAWVHRRLPAHAASLDPARLCKRLRAPTIGEAWRTLVESPGPGPGPEEESREATLDSLCPGAPARIRLAAEKAATREVDMLGSGPVRLGAPIDWQIDFVNGVRWPNVAARRIDVLDLRRQSDIKVPWELARLQWLLPLGQAYRLDGDERWAEAARAAVDDWISGNPPAEGVNWTSAMEAALRAISLIWLARALARSPAWADDSFRFRVLKTLYLHGVFIAGNLEWADVNGNHLLADATGLVAIGLALGPFDGSEPRRWHRLGWDILTSEMRQQVHPDGVNFEASAGYHRLALELFLMAALWRQRRDLDVPRSYRDALSAMARFTLLSARPDGTAPLWGDGDDGRVLPLGTGARQDHRSVAATVATMTEDDALLALAAGEREEAYWLLGPERARQIPDRAATRPRSAAFRDSGVYVMRSDNDWVFADAGAVGMRGRGGHGHNDCLSFEAILAGQPVIVDSGTFVYSASIVERNRFRGTAAHNTPMIDGAEQNRLVRPEYLWVLREDAKPRVLRWESGERRDVLTASHSGYERLSPPVTPTRTLMLDKSRHRIVIVDSFQGRGDHLVEIPFHLPPGAAAEAVGHGAWRIHVGGHAFGLISHSEAAWETSLRPAWHSHAYGMRQPSAAVVFSRRGSLAALSVAIGLASADFDKAWLSQTAAEFLLGNESRAR